MTISFKDKVAIVTGAGGGLGKAYALELARRAMAPGIRMPRSPWLKKSRLPAARRCRTAAAFPNSPR